MSQIIRINNLESMTYGVQVQTPEKQTFYVRQIQPWFDDEKPTQEQEFSRIVWHSSSHCHMDYAWARQWADLAQEVLSDKYEVSLFIITKEDK
jgi:hypothetical protein